MQPIDLLLSARWVLPIAPENAILENTSIAIQKGGIIALLPTSEALQTFAPQQHLSLDHHVLMPGLVNAHTHVPMNLFKGLADDLVLMDWLNHHIWPAEAKILNDQSVFAGSLLGLAEMLRGGTTCINDHYFYPHSITRALNHIGMRGCVGLWIGSVPTSWASTEEEYFEKAKVVLQNQEKNSLVHYAFAPHAPYTVSDAAFKEIQQLSEHYDLQIHMHLHETKSEVEQALQQYHQRGIAHLNNLGFLSNRLIAVHMTQMLPEEISLIAEKSVHVVHCPESNMKLGSGFAPIAEMLKQGVNVALGTDGAASNNDLDMFGEMRTAAFIAKGYTGDPTVLPAEEILKMATLNGAKALGLDQEIGSLEPGKSADIISIDLNSFLLQPVYNPISHLVYALDRQQVSHAWIRGKQLLNNGKFTMLEVDAIVNDIKPWTEQLKQFKAIPVHMVRS